MTEKSFTDHSAVRLHEYIPFPERIVGKMDSGDCSAPFRKETKDCVFSSDLLSSDLACADCEFDCCASV